MIRALSPAKVNLCLHVLAKRQDGYHEIASLMQRISLCDEMTFKKLNRGIRVCCPDSDLPENEENIAFRAAQSFFARFPQIEGGIEITIHKRIPVAAGLGGGSSNAATTLMTLNEIYKTPCSKETLMEIGGNLGADVPFFIFAQPAWAFGIGERLQAAENIPSHVLVLVNPGFPLSTKMIYQGLNLRLTNKAIHYSIPRFCSIRDLAKGLFNDLEAVSVGMHPVISDIKEELLRHGALSALMSGSGPTVFGIFESEQQADAAQQKLAQVKGRSVFIAVPV